MSGVHRFLSRSRKPPPDATKKDGRHEHFGRIFTLDDNGKKKPDKDEDRKIKGILARLQSHGVEDIVEANVEYALRHATPQGDPDSAFRLLMLLEDTYEGIVRPFDPDTKLLGAVNRESVTCYLDALLFAMFARLDSFEAMLYESFEDIERRKLAGMLRLWVNLLRMGKLIPTDVTEHLQEALAACGWPDARRLKQQDPSEAFGFITGKLELPLLTLKMDLYHTGKEDPQDDHKFINERLLEVALIDKPLEGRDTITLEDCLEHYFNNRIEVKRHLENQRRNTLRSNEVDEKRDAGLHVEVAEIGERSETPLVQTPVAETPDPPAKTLTERFRPSLSRNRADSIFSQRKVEIIGVDPAQPTTETSDLLDQKGRKMSTRTEVLMPAWQFFKLLPWYTDHMPTSDAQVAAHFSKKRPVLGICLKRYSYTNSGQARRLDTYIDIPLEIAVPNFVSDDDIRDTDALVGNFRLLLQSVVCHRGVSVHSGHYICLSRGTAPNAQRHRAFDSHRGSDTDSDIEDPWMRFDDLAKERVSYVDIHHALKEETPYLLFYQVQPIDEYGRSIHDLPSYEEATSRAQSDPAVYEKVNPSISDPVLTETDSEHNFSDRPGTETLDWMPASERASFERPATLDAPRGRSSASIMREAQRHSIATDESGYTGSISGGSVPTESVTISVPATPSEDKSNSFFSVLGSRRNSRPPKSRSRTASNGPDGSTSRFTLNMSKLTAKMGRGDLPPVHTSDAASNELGPQTELCSPEKDPAIISTIALPEDDGRGPVVLAKLSAKDRKKHKDVGKQDKKAAKRATQDDRECRMM